MLRFGMLIIILVVGCQNDKVVTSHANGCNEGKEEFREFLRKHPYVVDKDDRAFEDSSFSFKAFWGRINEQNRLESRFQDTMFSVLDFGDLDEMLKLDGVEEVIRVVKGTGAFGLNEYRVVEIAKTSGSVRYKRFLVKFDRSCGSPRIKGNSFSSRCFTILEPKHGKLSEKDWQTVRSEMNGTDFLFTAYYDRKDMGVICDGFSYSIDYNARGLERTSMSKACPGEKTAIALISERVLDVTR